MEDVLKDVPPVEDHVGLPVVDIVGCPQGCSPNGGSCRVIFGMDSGGCPQRCSPCGGSCGVIWVTDGGGCPQGYVPPVEDHVGLSGL